MVRSIEINNTCPDVGQKTFTWLPIIVNSIDMRHRIPVIAFNVILMLSTIFLNLLSVITIRKSSQLKNKVCYFVILVQSVVDFVVGIFGMPLFIVFLAASLLAIRNSLAIVILIHCVFITTALSTVTLSAMTLERYIAVLHPYSHKTHVTKGRILTYVGVFGLIEITTTISAIFTWSFMQYYLPITILVHFFFTVFTYTRIYFVVRKLDHAKRPVDIAQNQSVKKCLLREIKHAKTCFITVLCFAICILPSATGPIFVGNGSAQFRAELFNWGVTVYGLNSSLNSMIFFWNKALLRKEACAILTPLYSKARKLAKPFCLCFNKLSKQWTAPGLGNYTELRSKKVVLHADGVSS
jgi:hypothetical protein